MINESTGRKYYNYHVKGVHKKGGNRWCTQMLAHIVATKSADHPAARARHAFTICDNLGDNKCNTVFAFCADLVWREWFDEFQLLYGPVGPTHNGDDAMHSTHNTKLKAYTLGTLGDVVNTIPLVWREARSRPTAVFFDVTYDFDRYYRGSRIRRAIHPLSARSVSRGTAPAGLLCTGSSMQPSPCPGSGRMAHQIPRVSIASALGRRLRVLGS